MLRPRPSQAPRPVVERSRSPPRGRLPPRRDAQLKKESTDLPVRMPLTCEQLERVLGPSGSTLIDICRSSGASVVLRPVLRDDGDSFVLEISGGKASVDSVLADLDDLECRFEEDDRSQAQSCEELFSEDADDARSSHQVDELEWPSYMTDYVLGSRSPGGKGGGKGEAVLGLQRLSGVAELTRLKTDDKDTARFRAEGEPSALARLRELVENRLAANEDVIIDWFEVPRFALGILFGKEQKDKLELEVESNTFLAIQGRQDKERGLVHISIRGTADQIDHAKFLIADRLDKRTKGNAHVKGKGKGKGK